LFRYYDLYQRLQLQFYVLLMMAAMGTRYMYRVMLQQINTCVLLHLVGSY